MHLLLHFRLPLTKVYFVGHGSTSCGARKYILSMTKVYIVIHGIQGASLFVYESLYYGIKKLLKNQIAGVSEVEIMYS